MPLVSRSRSAIPDYFRMGKVRQQNTGTSKNWGEYGHSFQFILRCRGSGFCYTLLGRFFHCSSRIHNSGWMCSYQHLWWGWHLENCDNIKSICAYQELKDLLNIIAELRFIFTSPAFVTGKAPKEKREFYITRPNPEWSLFGLEFQVMLRLMYPLTAKRIIYDITWLQRCCRTSPRSLSDLVTVSTLWTTARISSVTRHSIWFYYAYAGAVLQNDDVWTINNPQRYDTMHIDWN